MTLEPAVTGTLAPKLIIAAGMRRSGSTLQFQLIVDVLAAAGIEAKTGWSASLDKLALAETPHGVATVIKTHAVPDCRAADIQQAGALVFYTSRDPRDCLVSYLRKYNSSFKWTIANKFLSEISAEFKFW